MISRLYDYSDYNCMFLFCRGSDGKPSFAALFGGHCLHCMAPYISGQLQEGACNYHSGFLGMSCMHKC